MTANLPARIWQHRDGRGSAFAKRYRCTLLVYVEYFDEMVPAIEREKQLKSGSRADKIKLIEAFNSGWNDLYSRIV